MGEDKVKILIDSAYKARANSYSPYSNYPVGAALLCEDGSIYMGCNVENASYPAGNCAERTAVFKAISEGKRNFKAIAIVGGKTLTSPCGVCRQVLREFVNPEEFEVIMTVYDEKIKNSPGEAVGDEKTGEYVQPASEYRIMTLSELLPLSFGPENLS